MTCDRIYQLHLEKHHYYSALAFAAALLTRNHKGKHWDCGRLLYWLTSLTDFLLTNVILVVLVIIFKPL